MSAPSGRLFRLCRKELRETLRDRRTIITLVLMPLLIYPLLSMTLQRFLLSKAAEAQSRYLIGVASEAEGYLLTEILEDQRSQPPPEMVEAGEGEAARLEPVLAHGMTPEELLAAGEIDVAASIESDEPLELRLTATGDNPASTRALQILVQRIQWFNDALLRERLAEFTGREVRPAVVLESRTIGARQAQPLLATVVPLVLVLMTITGAVYPAIDLTAGERERGTIEALIASPIPRSQVLLAKYVAVVTVALLTAVANLGAMFLTLWSGGLMQFLVGPSERMPWLAILQILALLVLFSGFFSAVLLALTSFARSFKEAQAYLIPLMLLALTPGILSLMPGVHLTASMAVVPLVSIVLLARDVLAGEVDTMAATAAVLSTAAYAAAALGVAARLFGSDAVLRGSELSIGSMFARPEKQRAVPTPGEAAMTLAVLFPLYFIASNLLMRADPPPPMDQRLLSGAALTMVLFGGLPWLVAWLARDATRTTFRLAAPPLLSLLAAFLLGLSLWPAAHEIFVIAERLGLGGLNLEKVQQVQETVSQWKALPVWLVLLTMAAAPALFEEWCFRGYLFSALRRVMSPARVIAITAVVFALFHVLTGSMLLIERFLPTAFLGLVLGWVAWRTGSLWPGIVLHVTHNGLQELAALYQEALARWGLGLEQQVQIPPPHLPVSWLATSALVAVIGAALMWWSTRNVAQRP